MIAYVTDGEEVYPVYSVSRVKDSHYCHEIELTEEEMAKIELSDRLRDEAEEIIGAAMARRQPVNEARARDASAGHDTAEHVVTITREAILKDKTGLFQ